MKIKTDDASCDTKPVVYFDITLNVDKRVEWLATDENGEVYGYWHDVPEYHDDEWDNGYDYGVTDVICCVDLEGMDWKETLMEIKQ